MMSRLLLKITVMLTAFLFLTFMVVDVDILSARGPGGGGGGPRGGGGGGGGGPRMGGPPPGGFSRGGPASGGSFSAGRPPGGPPGGAGYAGPPGGPGGRPVPPPPGGPGGRPMPPPPGGGHWDHYGPPPPGFAVGAAIAGAAIAVGTAFTTSEFFELPCSPTTLDVGEITYYLCGDNWYIRGFSSGEAGYVAVDRPPGY